MNLKRATKLCALTVLSVGTATSSVIPSAMMVLAEEATQNTVVTKWIDRDTNKPIKEAQTTAAPLEHGEIEHYTFLKSIYDTARSTTLNFKTAANSTTQTQTKPRHIILYLDRSSSFHSEVGQKYVNTLAEKIIDSLKPGDELALIGTNNTAAVFSQDDIRNFSTFSSDKEKLKAAITGDGHDAAVRAMGEEPSTSDGTWREWQNNREIEKVFGYNGNIKDLTIVSLFDDTAIDNDDYSTVNQFKRFVKKGGRIVAYIPNVAGKNNTNAAFSSIGVPSEDVEKINFNASDPKEVADKLTESLTKKTVTTIKEPDQEAHIVAGGNDVTVTSALLIGPNGQEDLPIVDGKVDVTKRLADGDYTVKIEGKGTGELVSSVSVDGKKADEKKDNVKEVTHLFVKNKEYTTKWVDENGANIKDSVTAEKTQEVGNIEGYRFIETRQDENGNVTHIFKKILKIETRWIDQEENKELKPNVTTEKAQDHVDIDGYKFVETKVDTNGNVTHLYKKIKVTTKWIDEDGKELKPSVTDVKASEQGPDIEGYKFVRSNTDESGNVTFVYKKVARIVTRWVDQVGNALKDSVAGETAAEQGEIDKYAFDKKEVDENGNVTYVFKQYTTIFIDEQNNVIIDSVRDSKPAEKIEIGGYTFVSQVDDNTSRMLVYHKIHTTWVDESDKLLKDSDGAVTKPGEISGYEYVKTETLKNGDVKHVFKEKKVEIATGIANNFMLSAATAIAALATGLFVVRKKKKH